MNLTISNTYPDGSLTYFEEKIWACLLAFNILKVEDFHLYFSGDKNIFIKVAEHAKYHQITANIGLRACNNIRFMMDNWQIIPEIPCKSVQKIQIKYKPELSVIPMVFIDDKNLCVKEVAELAIQEGFDNAEQFYKSYPDNLIGRINHWTNLRHAE